jgi:hypothetical protein
MDRFTSLRGNRLGDLDRRAFRLREHRNDEIRVDEKSRSAGVFMDLNEHGGMVPRSKRSPNPRLPRLGQPSPRAER